METNEKKLFHLLTSKAPFCPIFRVIKMRITSKDGEKSVSQSAPTAVKRVPIAMLALEETDVNVNLAGAFLRESQIRVVWPDAQSLLDFLIHLSASHGIGRGILTDFVSQVFDSPTASWNWNLGAKIQIFYLPLVTEQQFYGLSWYSPNEVSPHHEEQWTLKKYLTKALSFYANLLRK